MKERVKPNNYCFIFKQNKPILLFMLVFPEMMRLQNPNNGCMYLHLSHNMHINCILIRCWAPLLSFSSIPDHVNLCDPLPSHVEPPHCRAKLPSIMYSYDHLDGVSSRQQLNTSTEANLLTPLSSYFKTADDLGSRVSLALETVRSRSQPSKVILGYM